MSESADVASVLAKIPIDYVLGPVILGVCINAFVYGFSVLQFIQYRTRLFRDSLPVQLLVLWTFVVDTVHTIALCWMLWVYVIENFTNPVYLFGAPWPFTATPIFLVATSAPIQFYFAYRVWCQSRSRILYWFIVVLSLADVLMGIVAGVFAFTHANVKDFKALLPIIDSWLALTTVCDGATSVVLTYYHFRHRSGFRRRQSLKNRIADLFIESTLLTSIFALADLIVYSCVPTTNFHIMLGYCIGRIYTCNLLAMVNARLKQKEDEEDGVIDKQTHTPFERRLEFTNFTGKAMPTDIQVNVSVREESETVVVEEDEPATKRCDSRADSESERSTPVLDHKSHKS